MIQGWLDKASNNSITRFVNENLRSTPPAKVIAVTAASTFALCWIKQHYEKGGFGEWRRRALHLVLKKAPLINTLIDKEFEKKIKKLEQEVFKHREKCIETLPNKGFTKDELLELLENHAKCKPFDWKKGNVSGTVYDGSEENAELILEAIKIFLCSNPLHTDLFPTVNQMEAEIIKWCCDFLHGDENACGVMTSGGTESNYLACLAYRELAEERGIKDPEIIIAKTAHCSFHKAAHHLKLKVREVDVDPETQQLTWDEVKKVISSRTAMIVVSAPQYPHGIVDDVEGISEEAHKLQIPVHVDGCLGAIVLAHLTDPDKPSFDYGLPGVGSISTDTHKYGYGPKGASVLTFRDRKLREKVYFCHKSWPGGIVMTPTLAGSRSGATIAATWVVMLHQGTKGYQKDAEELVAVRKYIQEEVDKMEGIEVIGDPQTTVIALLSHEHKTYLIGEKMGDRGWNLNFLQHPNCFHLCLTKRHTQRGVKERFVRDLQECIKYAKENPFEEPKKLGAIYGTTQSMPQGLLNETLNAYQDLILQVKPLKSSKENGKEEEP